MENLNKNSSTYRFFSWIADKSTAIIIAGVVLIVGLAMFIPKIIIDTSVEAFIHPEHPSLVYRDQVKEMFGLSDPVIMAIVNEGDKGIYEPETLNLITWLTDSIQKIEGVDPDRITSLSTENNIYGTEEGMMVEPFIEDKITTSEEAANVRDAVNDFPLYVGNMVSEDGTTTLIVVELLDKKEYGFKVYNKLLELGKSPHVAASDVAVHVAGEGAVTEFMSYYVMNDAKTTMPLAFLVITIVLIMSFRTLRAVLISNFVVMGSLLAMMGIMVAMGVPVFLPSSIIAVICIAISVADSIHIFGQYYENTSKHPNATQRDIVIYTMVEMWRPVLITSVTNIAGFLAMGYTSIMPPIRVLGLFSSVGVFFALLFSVFVLPAVLVRLKLQQSKAYKSINGGNIETDWFGKLMNNAGRLVLKTPYTIMIVSVLVIVIGAYGMTKIELNDTMVEYINKKEPIYKADQLLNNKMNGTNFFDIVVETEEEEGLFNADYLKKIESLENFIKQQPHVKGTTSIVDLLKQMNRSINENREEMYRLPEDSDLIAQYFLLYSASSDPTDFEKYVDYDYRMANIRVAMDNGQYKYTHVVKENIGKYMSENFNEPGIKATTSGWLNVLDYWIGSLKSSHFLGVILAILVVLIIISLSYKSFYIGILAIIPVIFAVFSNYAIMGYTETWLNVASAVTTAVAVGIGVDFSVHFLNHLLVYTREKGMSLDDALQAMYPSTGRALLFNFFALAMGFGVNLFSAVPPWGTFGLLVVTMICASFIGSLSILPALIKVLKPKHFRPVVSSAITTNESNSEIVDGELDEALVSEEVN